MNQPQRMASPTDASAAAIEVRPLAQASRSGWIDPEIDAIFFESAGARSFQSSAEREAFRHRWLDRYVYRYSDDCFVALSPEGTPVGYLAGCTENAAELPRFLDIPYFRVFADVAATYPAHLHVNIARSYQRQGIGRRLITAFAEHCRRLGRPGFHVVTAADADNLRFYRRCKLKEVATRTVNGRQLSFLGRRLQG
ncbi:MAG: GNAT family N-acetyltransferase [Hyphomicrobiaceae bacterium]